MTQRTADAVPTTKRTSDRLITLVLVVAGALAGALVVYAAEPALAPDLPVLGSAEQQWWQRSPDAEPAAAGPLASFEPTATDRAEAIRVVTTIDTGEKWGLVRWEGERVAVRIASGDSPDARANVSRVLAWLTEATGVSFELTGDADAPMVLHLASNAKPRGDLTLDGRRIVGADVSFDPTWERHVWEELLQSAGAYGDHSSRADSIFSTRQTAMRPGPFDAWVLRSLYTPEVLPTDAGALFN